MLRARRLLVAPVCALGLALFVGPASADRGADALPDVFDKAVPEGVQELRAIQTHVKKIVDQVMPCVVGLQIGAAQGSGVIIDKQGHILTAAHVSGDPGRPVHIILPDGKRLKGVTLGANIAIDSGLVRITQPDAAYPCVGAGQSSELRKGQWVIAIGHPGGYQAGRPPVVRVGRVLDVNGKIVRTDCALVGGDSGGPLFDMHGQVVAIHSRIGGNITFNIHVPIDTYTETWDRLQSSEVWGSPFNFLSKAKPSEPFLGVRPDPEAKQFRVRGVTSGSPAERAGLRGDDVILKIDDRDIASVDDFDAAVRSKAPGERITLHVQRGDEVFTIQVTLGQRPLE